MFVMKVQYYNYNNSGHYFFSSLSYTKKTLRRLKNVFFWDVTPRDKTSQKTAFFIVTALKTLTLTQH
jgi:hypothetical protein